MGRMLMKCRLRVRDCMSQEEETAREALVGEWQQEQVDVTVLVQEHLEQVNAYMAEAAPSPEVCPVIHLSDYVAVPPLCSRNEGF